MKSFKYLSMLLSVLATGVIATEAMGSYEDRQPAYQKQPARSRIRRYQRPPEQSNRQVNNAMLDEDWRRDRQDRYVTARGYDRDRYERYGRNNRYYYDDRNGRRVGDSRVWPWNWGR